MEFKFVGSWISGTMREEDLIPSFLDLLGELDPERRAQVEADNQDVLGVWDDEDEERPADWDEKASWLLNEVLFDALNEFAPPYFYFGANEGDGADYGFWFSAEAFEQAVEDGEVVKVEAGDQVAMDEAAAGGCEYIAEVTDHGNITLRSAADQTIVWEVV